MAQDVKQYRYQDVIDFASKTGPMANALNAIQDDLVELAKEVQKCEELYHGDGTSARSYTQYQGMYNNIGDENGGFWGIVKVAADLQDEVYSNAMNDQIADKGQ